MQLDLLKYVIFVASAAIRVNSFQIRTISAYLFANGTRARSSWRVSPPFANGTRARSSLRVSATIADTVSDDETLESASTPQDEASTTSTAKVRSMPVLMIKRLKNIPSSALAGCGVMVFFVGRSALVKTRSRSSTVLAVFFLLSAFLRKKTSGSSSSLSDTAAESASDVNDDGDKEESNGEGDYTTIGTDLLNYFKSRVHIDRVSVVQDLLTAEPVLPKRIHRTVLTPMQRVILNPVGNSEQLQDLIVSTMIGSQLIYSLAAVRGILKNHDQTVSQYPWVQESSGADSSGKGKKKRLVNFKNTNNIITNEGKPPYGKTTFQDRVLKYPISLGMILDFISENRHFLTMKGELMFEEAPKDRLDMLLNILRAVEGELLFDDSPEKTEVGTAKVKEVEKVLRILHAKSDSIIIEFDDKFSNEELVYGIMVNKTNKRITICFRGTVGGKDWGTNLNCLYKTPECIRKACGDDVKLHKGFCGYLFGESNGGLSKYQRIVNILKETYQEYPGYQLYVCGHSLGGALAILLAFTLAATQDVPESPQPIKTITFACPPVGDKGYGRAFEVLAKQDRIRHVRITNEGDVIPLTPFPISGYTQTGINLHLRKDDVQMEVTRNPRARTVMGQFRRSPPLEAHGLKGHEDNLLVGANLELLRKSYKELYEISRISLPNEN